MILRFTTTDHPLCGIHQLICLKEKDQGLDLLGSFKAVDILDTFLLLLLLLTHTQNTGFIWEKAMAPHSSTLAWKTPWMEEPGGLQPMGSLKSRTRLSDFTFTFHFHAWDKGNGNPLQCSCLENPRDRGAWWAAVYEVAQSWT